MTNDTPLAFPIVGIGASAGGLAAFETFFSGMPQGTDPGMAFVLVQHLAPDHKSILSDLVKRYTRMQVFEVEDGVAVKPNCVYIIPPNRDMALLHGTLQLLEQSAPRGQRLPIDHFFRSLAEDQRERAILIEEHLEAQKKNLQVQIFATDIDANAIEQARAGIYPASIAADVTPERLARFFTQEPGHGAYRVHKTIRDMLVFSEHDLIKDPPFSRLDLISCRNLLIYMGGELQRKIIPLFHYALGPGGVLFLGTSETVGEFTDIFATIDRESKLYRRNDDVLGLRRAVIGNFLPPFGDGKADPRRKPPAETPPEPREVTVDALLRRYAPSGALVDEHGEIRYLHGRTGEFLEPSPGDAGMNILRMAREGLRRELTTALHKSVTERQAVRRTGVRVKSNGDFVTINLEVVPVLPNAGAGFEAMRFLVAFEPQGEATAAEGALPEVSAGLGDAGVDARILALEQELRAKEEYLQSTNEELESSNEELRSSNEEMQSVNEELQSTNEELESSKEELQSLNEELATVNAELQQKVGDLSRAMNDMNNLLAGTGVGTIFVDHQSCILRFTPDAARVVNLIPTDIGRPLGHIVTNLVGYDRLSDDVRTVLDSLIPIATEVETKAGVWYSLRIRPYRTLDNVIEGAVITLIDINEIKGVREELRLSEGRNKLATKNREGGIDGKGDEDVS